MRKTIKSALLILSAMLVGTVAFAQVTTSSMNGKISDEAGPVAGAVVTAVHQPTGSQFYAVSDAKGTYRLNNITSGGPYTVTVSCLGYTPAEFTDISVALSDNLILDVKLLEESIQLQSAAVVAEGGLSNMRSERAGAITSLDRKQINEVPTVSRSLNDLLKMDPNSYVSGSYAYIGGAGYRSSFVTVNGAAFNNAFGIGSNLPSNGSPISIDALDQVSVSVTPYDVRQSGFTGGGINAVTRSGSNKFEGSAYSYFNNQNFKGVWVGDNELTRTESQYLMYGARVGGPIIKDKLFFFANFEIEKNVTPGPSRVASTPEKPYTNGNDGVARPSADIMDGISAFLKEKYSYETGPYQGYSAADNGFKILARIDWNINRNHKFNVYYSQSVTSGDPLAPSTSTSGLGDRNFTANSRQAMTAIYYKNARYYQGNSFKSASAELNSRFFDGKLGNVLRATWSNQDDSRTVDSSEFPFVDIAVAGNTYTSFGYELFSYGNVRYVNTVNVTDELTLSAGIHNALLGIQYEHNNTKNGFQRFGAGYYQFAFDTEEELRAAVNNGTLLDNPAQFAITHSLNPDLSQAFPQFDFNQLSIYAQDEISFSPRFKLTAGIRIDFPMYPALNTYNEQVATTQLRETNGNGGYYDTSALPKTTVMYSPRIGFNWDILGNRDLVLRGGTGVFTGRIPFVWIVSQAGDSGVLQVTTTRVAAKGQEVPSFTTDRMDMATQLYGTVDPSTFSQMSISSCTLIDENLRMPQTWKSSLALDANLPGGIKATLEGVINYDINSTVVTNLGLKDPVWTLNGIDSRPIYGATYDNKLTAAYMITNGKYNGWYYAVTAKLRKSFSWGLSLQASYTHAAARNIFDGSGDQPYSTWNVPYTVYGNNSQELSYAGYVMPHRVMAQVSYAKDYAKHFGSQISLFYNGGPQGRTSYTYTSTIVGDGGAKNLIYVPKSKDELTFTDYTPEKWDKVYTAEEQAQDFWNFIEQDKYLSSRKGQYAERNGVVLPWSNRIDLKFNQNFYFFTGSNHHKHTVQLGVDILNFANMLNKNWGHAYTAPVIQILDATGYVAGAPSTPTYHFRANGTERITSSFTDSIGFGSTWSMQLNLRYIF